VLDLYFRQELTMKEIGEVLAVTESRVSQLQTRALTRLRTLLAERGYGAVPAASTLRVRSRRRSAPSEAGAA
jgi:hypothetical protein